MRLPENSGLEGTKYEIKMISKKPFVYQNPVASRVQLLH